jgi:hypothetical protein
MIIDLRACGDVKSGAYSIVHVFEDRAYKLFRSKPEVPPRLTEDGRREIFIRQCQAYRVALSSGTIAKHIPMYFGTITVEDVIWKSGDSIKDRFLLDCCYVTELLDGPEHKVTDAVVLENFPHIAEERKRLEQYHIRTMDSSVFYAYDQERFKIIDFEIDS